MNQQQLTRMQQGKGFIAALDQSGGSTPKALQAYGIDESAYSNDQEMFDVVHEMRTRMIKSPAFDSEFILGAILFENTIDKTIDGLYTADYLWQQKGIVPFLKVDKGLQSEVDDVQLMKPFDDTLPELLNRAQQRHIFGTKMRSVIKLANPVGIKRVVEQQFTTAKIIANAGFVPIIEPEVDINSPTKAEAEAILKQELQLALAELDENVKVMLKLSIPTVDNLYQDLLDDPRVVRIVALSGGFSQTEANAKLAKNHGVIASFSRALSQDLNANQTDDEYDNVMKVAVQGIYAASIA
ncbi:fructose bisphosphate aldolase [Motilimonas sp. KMU-193]|uniref:fructose bisphosphate aldolase n=1 Tax=Motilimonas sp. KMU-193 TaxID=3388668 RepID=UPI00396B320B